MQVFTNFRQKMWMTLGMGTFFLILYLMLNLLITKYLTQDRVIKAMEYGMKHPTYFLMWGLFIFMVNGLLVYTVRLFIKYFYLMRHRT
ncbi:MAG: hypothetical protein CMO81_06405 [Waddliaceae bacterium]|nr:hypothetical protein [Waddliaceae bacterium]